MSKSESRRRNKLMQLRCTEEEEALIKKKAEVAGITTSDFMRRSALSRPIVTRTDLKLMNELRSLGGLQKHLFNKMQEGMTTELSRQFSEILVAIQKAILAMDMKQVPVTL